MKTVFKMMDISPDGKISREDYVKYAEQERDHLKLLNPDEAEKVYSTFLALSDMLGLDKFAKDGGMSYTPRELDIVRRVMSQKDMPLAELLHTLNSAYFRAIDTNGDHFLERSEWINYLKIMKTFTTEEQAMQSFDSLDKNKDGVISLEEFAEKAVDFWCNLGEKLEAQNMYGTKDL
jgi:Ca2+-binding EF-hand superfamily protein